MHYSKVRLPRNAPAERATFTLDLVKFSKIVAESGNALWCFDNRDSVHFKPHRYNSIADKIKANDFITMPVIFIKNDVPDIYDGEHRCYVLLDEGYTSVPVCCPKQDLASLIETVGVPSVTQRFLAGFGFGKRASAHAG